MKQKLNFITAIRQKNQLTFLCISQVVFLFVGTFTGNAQNLNMKFDHLGNNSGISNNNINDIIQDSQGFMWFGTDNGLNKYDGYQFTIYKNNPANVNSLNNNSIKNIIEDKNCSIWVATWGGGLNKFEKSKNKFSHFTHDPSNTKSISSDFITCLLENEQGNLWIGTGDGGLDLFDLKKNQFVHYVHPHDSTAFGNDYITSVFEDIEHNLWIGTINRGLYLLNKENGTVRSFQHTVKDINSLSDNAVNAIFEDKKKNLWIGTNDGGLDMLNKRAGEFSHFKNAIFSGQTSSQNAVLSITCDNNGNFWIGTRDGGLNIFNPQTKVSYNYHHDDLDISSLPRNTVDCIYKDTKGDMWMSTSPEGVSFVNVAGNGFMHYEHNSAKNSLSDNNVSDIYEDSDENLWIGTNGSGLNLFDRTSGKFISYKHQANNINSICGDNVLSVCEDSKGNLWIGTWGYGITVFNKKKNTFKHFKNNPAIPSSLGNNNVWKIIEDKEKNIWVGTYGGGLNLYNPVDNSFKRYENNEKDPASLSNNQVITLFEDSRGFLWVGTDGGGLNQFNKKTKKFIHYVHDDFTNSLSYNFVSGIFEDRAGNLYLTTGIGLNYLNTKTRHFTVYTANNGFTNDATCGISQDTKGNLWISTGEGITCFSPATKKFINFNTEDGLHFNMYNIGACCKSRSGIIFFGGNNGFDGFFPDSIKKVSFDPPLVVTNFQIFNKEVPIAVDEKDPSPLKDDITETRKITIPYSSTVISFEFASLNYSVQARKQYAYRLRGFDKTWNDVGTKRLATYTNLDPGKYVFEVKGFNNKGEWSSRTISIQLIITPPFWLTWWFKSFIVIVIICGVTGFYKYRMHAIKARTKKLEHMVQEQTKQLKRSTEEEHKAREEAEQTNIFLERKNKELEQFAYVASHDLQEPLRTTSSFVNLIQRQYQGQLDEKADKYFNYILDASDRMRILIKSLLDYSLIGNKKEFEPVDCNVVMKNVLADLSVAIEEAKADISCSPLPVINGYPTEIKQLFQNLLINAIKFRKKNVNPQITISVEKIKNNWEFIFKDNGIGIEMQHREKIFDIFQRLHNRTEYKGSGIGLSNCKKIVELHNGKIWVESKLGVGSTFHFTIHEKVIKYANEKMMNNIKKNLNEKQF